MSEKEGSKSSLDVAIIIVSWNVREYLADCLRSVCNDLSKSPIRGETWVVDNASTDGTVSLLRALYPQVHVIANEENYGFAVANNQGMRAAAEGKPRYYFFLNPDTFIRPGAINELVTALDKRPKAGVAGARLIYGDGRFQHSAFYFPGLGQLVFELMPMPSRLYESRFNGRYSRRRYSPRRNPFKVDHPLGATMMVRSDVAESTHGFDESFRMYCEEIDWSWRVREAGWEILTVPSAEVIHYGGESTSQVPANSIVDLWSSRAKLYRKHHGRIRYALASRLVSKAMKRKARNVSDPELSQAYNQVATIWSANGTK
jgi:GT2 family glycosyltransferase